MYKKLILAFTVMTAVGANAQRLHLGLNTAVTKVYLLENGIHQDPRFTKPESQSWAPIGASIGYEARTGYGLGIDFYLSQLKNTYKILDVDKKEVGQRILSYKYWNLPLMLTHSYNNSGKARLKTDGGAQVSFLSKGREYFQQFADSAKMKLPDGESLPKGAINNGDGTYTIPKYEIAYNSFAQRPVSILLGFGMDIDLGSRLLLTLNARAVYTLTDMRNDDLIKGLMNKSVQFQALSYRRTKLVTMVQFGLHYSIGW
jgi:hypothetical protein